MRKRFGTFALIALLFTPGVSSAQNLAELQAQIQALLQQVSALEAQLGVPGTPPPLPTSTYTSPTQSYVTNSGCLVLSRTMSLGSTGTSVSALQTFLISQGHLGAGNASGYFGPLTRAAIQSFQAKHGIVSSGTAETTGFGATGPRTRALIQSLSCGSSSSYTPPSLPSPSLIGGSGIPCIAGNVGVPLASGSSITLYEQPSVAGGPCRAQIRQCLNGFLNGDPQFQFNSCTSLPLSTQSCELDGVEIPNGASRTFYSDSSVDFDESCSSFAQSRTCRDGKLSGSSRFRHASCKIGAADKCVMDGITVSHGSSRTFYNKKTVPFGDSCTLYGQSRTCSDGDFLGSSDYKYATCAAATSNNCTLDGVTVNNTSNRAFYSSRTVAFGSTCTSVSQTRTCTKGVLDGGESFQYSSCSVGAAGSCTLDGATVAHGASRTFYSTTQVGFGVSCSTVAQSRTCTNGALGGDSSFNKANCSVGGAASCELDSLTVAHNGTATFYKNATVPFGTTCTQSSNSSSRKCTNGTLAGDSLYNKASCAVAPAAACTLDGQTVAHGSSRAFYFAQNIPSGELCSSYSTNRTCSNGTLSGNAAYKYAACAAVSGGACALDNAVVEDGATKAFYSLATAPTGQLCTSYKQDRTCTSGTLSGTNSFNRASCFDSTSCTLDGLTIETGTSTRFYASKLVPFGSSCTSVSNSLVRSCTNGALSGSASFQYSSCAVTAPKSCTLDGVTIAHDASGLFYTTKTVAFGGTCASVSQSRTCNDGVLTGSSTYRYGSCSVNPPLALAGNEASVANALSALESALVSLIGFLGF